MKKHSRTGGGSAGGSRATRVAEQIHQELAQMIAREVKDPRIGMVTLTSVDITADYAYATVHFTVLPSDDETVARSLEGLRRSAGFMRSQLGRRVRIHTNPELRFVHDRSVEHGVNLSHLIDVANATRASDDVPGEADGTPPAEAEAGTDAAVAAQPGADPAPAPAPGAAR
jgi:ribosome-binding factor A